jgi:hypothetical protein
VAVGFVDLHGAVVELIQPLGDDSPVTRQLEQGQRLVHLCYEVQDFRAYLRCGILAHGFARIRATTAPLSASWPSPARAAASAPPATPGAWSRSLPT